MFLIGLNRDAHTGAAGMAVLEKRLRQLRRHYRLVETAQWPPDTPAATVEAALFHHYHDPRWTVRRKVFSQDRRPAKNLRTPPLVAVRFSETDTGPIDALRARKLRVEGIAVTREADWRREDFPQLCRGNNYFVPESSLENVLRTIVSQGRLAIGPACPTVDLPAAGPPPSFPSCAPTPPGDPAGIDLWTALSLPVWFTETVRKIVRYGDA